MVTFHENQFYVAGDGFMLQGKETDQGVRERVKYNMMIEPFRWAYFSLYSTSLIIITLLVLRQFTS